jgi:hypothetical protein
MIPDEGVVMEKQQHPESAVDCQPQSTKGFCKYGSKLNDFMQVG